MVATRTLVHTERFDIGIDPKGDAIRIALEFSDAGDATILTQLSLRQSDDEARWAGIGRVDVDKFVKGKLVFEDSREASVEDESLTLDFREIANGDHLALASGLERLGAVHYVSADRLGPQDFSSGRMIRTSSQWGCVGSERRRFSTRFASRTGLSRPAIRDS